MPKDASDRKIKLSNYRRESLFLELVEEYYNPYKRNAIHPEDAVHAVVAVLNNRMGGGEMCKVAAIMPNEIRKLFKQAGVDVTGLKNEASAAA